MYCYSIFAFVSLKKETGWVMMLRPYEFREKHIGRLSVFDLMHKKKVI